MQGFLLSKLYPTSIFLACFCFFFSSDHTFAQQENSVLIVVSNESDADYLTRIGSDFVQVRVLLSDQDMHDYQACNSHVTQLVDFRLFINRGNADCPNKRFWQERLLNSNESAQILNLPSSRKSLASNNSHVTQQLHDLHQALLLVLPEHSEHFDANLENELLELNSQKSNYPQLVKAK